MIAPCVSVAILKILITTLLLSSCLPGADLAGHYVLSGVMEVGSELLLEPGGTFQYMLAYGAADYSANGHVEAGRRLGHPE